PAGGVDFNRSPSPVAEVEVEPAVQPADAEMDHAFGCIEMRFRFDYVQGRLERLGTWRALRRLEETARQPPAKAFGTNGPTLPVAIDVEVGEAGAIRRVKQFG